MALLFSLPGMADKRALLKDTDAALTGGKTIQTARASSVMGKRGYVLMRVDSTGSKMPRRARLDASGASMSRKEGSERNDP